MKVAKEKWSANECGLGLSDMLVECVDNGECIVGRLIDDGHLCSREI